jgi:hypothetical protein
VFELQERVATSVAGVIEPALQAAETARSTKSPTSDMTAYDLYLRACSLRAITNSQGMRLSAVMVSSTMPSAK